jgi:RNA-directed DNA polymerase
VQRIKRRIRAILRPGQHAPWADVAADLNPVLRGWAAYFSYGTRLMAYRVVDQYVADLVRHLLGRRHKVPTRGTRRFSAQVVFGDLGVFQLRRFHLGSAALARLATRLRDFATKRHE